MKKDFYAVYCIKLDQKEIDQAVELDIIDDNDRFEADKRADKSPLFSSF